MGVRACLVNAAESTSKLDGMEFVRHIMLCDAPGIVRGNYIQKELPLGISVALQCVTFRGFDKL
jgi:hypothetical protein